MIQFFEVHPHGEKADRLRALSTINRYHSGFHDRFVGAVNRTGKDQSAVVGSPGEKLAGKLQPGVPGQSDTGGRNQLKNCALRQGLQT